MFENVDTAEDNVISYVGVERQDGDDWVKDSEVMYVWVHHGQSYLLKGFSPLSVSTIISIPDVVGRVTAV